MIGRENNLIKKQKGFTLIEVLLSLVILTIILTSFFTFFSQSMLFTKKNEDNLIAINLASKALSNITENPSLFIDVNLPLYNTNQQNILSVEENGTFQTNSRYKLTVNTSKETFSFDGTDIYVIHVKIYMQDNSLVTETFGYMKGS